MTPYLIVAAVLGWSLALLYRWAWKRNLQHLRSTIAMWLETITALERAARALRQAEQDRHSEGESWKAR